ncbi:alanine racemase [Lachnospiraceae bacterium TWA4]|nr:alanine racemase [Lachnospiraceae bacterium TWA4]
MQYDGDHVYDKQTVLKIDSSAILHNVEIIQKKIKEATLIAVIKENGYGMGLLTEYNILKDSGITFFAVTNTKEALALREFGCTQDILLMSPIFNYDEALVLCENRIVLLLNNMEQAKLLKNIYDDTGIKARVHIGIETGMGRYGFLWNDIPDLSALPEFLSIEGCYTHLHGKPKGYKKEALVQKERFLQATEELERQNVPVGMRHICNSAGTMSLGSLDMDAVRVGSALLGKCARGGGKLKNALWVESTICQTIELPKGSTVGYQACAVLKRDSRLGVVRAGHGDGLFLGYADSPEGGLLHLISRKLRPKRYRKTVMIQDKKVPLVGRAGVAHFVVDLTDTPFEEGETVRIEVNPLFVHPSVQKSVI